MLVQRELRQNVRRDQSQVRFEPCLPRLAKEPPTGAGWIHEIKHDGFRIIARREGDDVRLLTRNGYDFSARFPLIVAAVAALPAVSCVIDGEAIACDERGLSVFEMIRWRQHDAGVSLCAFDLIELDGEDLRRKPVEVRKATLKGLLRRARPGLAFNRHFQVDGSVVYEQACTLGCEASCRSGLGRRTDQAAPIVGSRPKTRRRQPRSASMRNGGSEGRHEAGARITLKQSASAKFRALTEARACWQVSVSTCPL
jgi:bifunctional non-homologous end joining protein LigD